MKLPRQMLSFFFKALNIPLVTFVTGGLLATAIQILFEKTIKTDIVLLLIMLSIFIFYTIITIEKINRMTITLTDKKHEQMATTITEIQKDVLAQIQSFNLTTRWVPNPTLERDEGYELSLKIVGNAQKSIYIISDYSPPDRSIKYTDERRDYLSTIEGVVKKHVDSNTQFEYKRLLQTDKADDIKRILTRNHLRGDEQTFEHCSKVIDLIQNNRTQVHVQLFVSKPIPSSPSILIVDQKYVLFTIPSKKEAIESMNSEYADLANFGVLYVEDHTGKLTTDFKRMFDSFASDSKQIAKVER